MKKDILVLQAIYIALLGLYYLIILIFNHFVYPEKYNVIEFDFPRHGLVLYATYSIVNVYLFLKSRQVGGSADIYRVKLLWLPYLIFLLISAVLYFRGFASIGAPIKHNVFFHLLITHIIAYFSSLAYLRNESQTKHQNH
jgi:uncharacterized membrane protein YtjA (UPF0391 family)